MAKELKNKKKIPYYPKDRFISFLSDYGFKVTFGDKDNTIFARKALEIILEEEEPIAELKYLRNEFEGITKGARAGLYDVICQDEERKRVFIIEMQVDNYEHLIERLQFYAFHLFTSLVNKGKKGFNDLATIYCICIIKGAITESVAAHQVITLKNEDNEIVMNNIIFHLIELAKFPVAKKDAATAISSKQQLFYTMKYAHSFNPKDKKKHPPFWENEFYQMALNRLDLSRMSPIEISLYESSLIRDIVVQEKINKDIQTAVDAALKLKEQEIQSKEQEIQSKEQEIQRLKTETVKKQLLRGKLTVEEIAEDVGVPIDFVLGIQKNLKKKR